MQLIRRIRLAGGLLCLAFLAAAPARAQQLFGVDWELGRLYRISSTNAAPTFVGPTGVGQLGDMQFGPNNVLYAVGTGFAQLYRIDPDTGAATSIGALGLGSVFEGGLAFAPDGTAYAASEGDSNTPMLVTINLHTGAATIVAQIGNGKHDVNGLAWRSDGKLIGIDRATNALIVIDPVTGAISQTMPIGVTVGAVGGMTARGDVGYFDTGGPGGSYPGSNELYSFDLFTGASTLVGSLDAATQGAGISGLAWDLTPGPTTYCTAKVNSQGCTPAIAIAGFPSATSSDACTISASHVLNQKLGVLFYSFQPDAKLALGGTLCVHPPVQRMPVQDTGGNPPPDDCSGRLSIEFNAWIQSGIDPALTTGATVYAQYFYRDAASSDFTGLTDAVSLTIGY